jgi:outer membrane cobalamin receptor
MVAGTREADAVHVPPLRLRLVAVLAPVLAATCLCANSAPASPPDSFVAPDSARAVHATTDTTRKLGMADTVTVLPAVHVDADRATDSDRASATTVRIERANLVRCQPSTTADALLAAPGVDVSRTGPWASRVSLRGLSGERVLVLVDGVRLQSGRGHGAQTSLVSVDRLESVELSPGSGGAEFGSDALGGVVELNTHHNLLGEPWDMYETRWDAYSFSLAV